MSKVSSIRWRSPELYEHARAYSEARHEKMNSIIMDAIAKYLDDESVVVSTLRAQTAAFPKESSEILAWSQGQDTRGWD
jgi:hypothetical protein